MKRTGTGFTLIELLVTLAIIAMLATAVIPVAEINMQRQHEKDLRHRLEEIRYAIDAYKKASDEGHIEKAVNASGYPPNLEVLVSGVTDARNPKGSKMYFLRRVPVDPMAENPGPYPADSWGKRSYASEPDNPSEGADVYDVYSRSTLVGLNGVPYKKW